MLKKTFSDIIPSEKNKKSIRNIPIPERKQNKIDILLEETAVYRNKHSSHAREQAEPEEELVVQSKTRIKTRSIKKRSRINPLWIGTGSLVVLVGLFFWLFSESSTVTIALKTETIPVNITSTTTESSYQVVASKKDSSIDLPTTGTPKKVEKKATGTVIIYNNFSSASQQLIATTRLETSEGLIYRLEKAVTVPGSKTSGGKTTPGSVEATIVADSIGPKYNLAKTDFTIPGFRGTTKYDGFYARSTTALTGGFDGLMGQVSDADLKVAIDNVKASLTEEIYKDISSQIPEDNIFFKDGGVIVNFTYSILSGESDKTILKGEMTGEALVFKKQDILSMINTVLGKEYRFDNLDSLVLSLNNRQTVSSFISKPNLTITYAGTLTTGQSFDTEALKALLAGKSKKQLPELLKSYPEIIKADAIIRPFWKNSFPSKTSKINVIVTK